MSNFYHQNPDIHRNWRHFCGRTSPSAAEAFKDADYACALTIFPKETAGIKWALAFAAFAISVLYFYIREF